MTLPKGYGPGGRLVQQEVSCSKCKESKGSLDRLGKHIAEENLKPNVNDKNHYPCYSRKQIGALTALFLIIMVSYLVVLPNLENYFWTLIACVVVLIVGFALCSGSYWIRRHKLKTQVVEKIAGELGIDKEASDSVFGFTLTAFPFLLDSDSKAHEHKTRVFGSIFGFLASLAITNALRTYYEQYIKDLTLSLPTLISIASENPLPGIRLVSFFAVAIPLAHAGYNFLSSLNIASIKDIAKIKETKRNTSAGLIAIFIISIIQVGFLFFLGNSVANENERISSVIQHQIDQSRAFLFWLTLTIISIGIGSFFIRVIIEKNRIPIEWIMLYAFMIGFLLTISLTIYESDALEKKQGQERTKKEQETLIQFNIVLMFILLGRAALDYIIGEGIYFPET
jgi:hypothetical protein